MNWRLKGTAQQLEDIKLLEKARTVCLGMELGVQREVNGVWRFIGGNVDIHIRKIICMYFYQNMIFFLLTM